MNLQYSNCSVESRGTYNSPQVSDWRPPYEVVTQHFPNTLHVLSRRALKIPAARKSSQGNLLYSMCPNLEVLGLL